MKLLRHGPPGAEKPGLLDASGMIRSLESHVPDIGPEQLSPAALARLARIDVASLPVVTGQPRLAPPLAHVGKFIGIGLNYSDHARESNMPIPAEPAIFMKATSCISGPNDPVVIPRGSQKTDWEVELGIVIGARARYVTRSEALAHVAGYLVVNDVSERAFQLERCGQWDKGKGCDTFGPIGPWLVTADEVGDPQNLACWLEVNGTRRQNSHTRMMIFDCATIVSYLSEFMTLLPGDLITTGTPAGVGLGLKPPQFLKAGDVMSLGIEKLGEQRQTCVVWEPET
jgi:2-keto-4-pentenoate hydratase/2-oxohepta-3-ene-1,7-dioic acid hydratase in catechol pathway